MNSLNSSKKIPLTNNSKIYVLCPAFFKTGGTELLHQYVFTLKKNGFDVYMVYPGNNEKGINPAFNEYINEYINFSEIIDEEQNVLVVPEVFTDYLRFFNNIKTVIWWESVDNYLVNISPLFRIKLRMYKGALKLFIKKILNKCKHYKISELKKATYHFVQSYYALDFLNKNSISNNVFYVSDYVNDIYLNNNPSYESRDKVVLYNPKKGLYFTKKIISCDKKHSYIPIVNMSNSQVFNLLNKSMVYIDFGNHPGKDRFPREAAKCGCCIITNKNGSAKFYNDIPIPADYKFDSKKKNIMKIIKTIDDCIENYNEKINDFESYRIFINSEKESFEKDVISCYEIFD